MQQQTNPDILYLGAKFYYSVKSLAGEILYHDHGLRRVAIVSTLVSGFRPNTIARLTFRIISSKT